MAGITNYAVTSDFIYIFVAVMFVDFVALCLTKYPGAKPIFGIKALDQWYTRFGMTAVAADLLSIMIGIVAARYIFTYAGFEPSNMFMFVAIILLFQLCHDAFFFLAVIQPLARGDNAMIDVFKDYAIENGGKIMVADAVLLLGTVAGATLLKNLPLHVTISVGLLTAYALCFVIYTRPAA